MKERPILFSGPMVKALLAGTKTQTRRIVDSKLPTDAETRKAAADWGFSPAVSDDIKMYSQNDYHRLPKQPGVFDVMGSVGWIADLGCKRQYRCPYGAPGDRLWVRETWTRCAPSALAPGDTTGPRCPTNAAHVVVYRTGSSEEHPDHPEWGHSVWRPSIHMPRWASRIMLEITDVRVERLRSISEEDARAEGLPDMGFRGDSAAVPRGSHAFTAAGQFSDLWDSINGKTAPWSSNPFVWVISFRVLS